MTIDFLDVANPNESPRRIRAIVAAGYPSVRAGLASLLNQAGDIDIVSAESSEIDVIVADVDSLSDDRLDQLTELDETVAFVYLGGDPATEGDRPERRPGRVSPSRRRGRVAGRGGARRRDGVDRARPLRFWPARRFARGRPEAIPNVVDVLTAREHEVLELVAAGYPNKTIARELGISEHTAKFHVGSLLSKLGAASRAEAVMIATRRGLLPV